MKNQIFHTNQTDGTTQMSRVILDTSSTTHFLTFSLSLSPPIPIYLTHTQLLHFACTWSGFHVNTHHTINCLSLFHLCLSLSLSLIHTHTCTRTHSHSPTHATAHKYFCLSNTAWLNMKKIVSFAFD